MVGWHGGSRRGRGKRWTKGGSGGNEGVGGSVCTRWGLKFGTARGWTSKRRAEGGGSFISLPHGIIYREDFRENTQRAPR